MPINSLAANLETSRIEQQQHEIDNISYKNALKSAALGQRQEVDNIILNLKDKSLVPIIRRELLLNLKNPNKESVLNWLDENANLAGADLIYEIAIKNNWQDAKKPIYNTPKSQNIKLNWPSNKNNIKANSEDNIVLKQCIAYFRANNDTMAIKIAHNNLGSTQAGNFGFFGGLAAYRNGDFATALMMFSIAANWQNGDDYLQSSAAFWAARSAQKLNNTDAENYFLKLAANHPLSFYGQIAQMRLGIWNELPIPTIYDEAKAAQKLIKNDINVRNALWLGEIGEINLAQKELRAAFAISDGTNHFAFAYIANAIGYQEFARQLVGDNGENEIAASFPIIDITPNGGDFVLDKALIFAIMRQESRFKANAISYAGARGLMQLMPKTAAWLAKRPEFASNPQLLHDNKLNVTLGEGYLEYVLSLNVVDNSIANALIAYNAGPGNLNYWKNRTLMSNDTLMFIEAIPNEQARDYAKKVLTNMWIYHKRLGQNAPSLEKLAQNQAPNYEPQDDPRKNYYANEKIANNLK